MSFQRGIYRIHNRRSGTYFDASASNRGEIHGWESRPQNVNQKWLVEESGQGFTLKNAEFNEFATVESNQDGSKVVLSGNPTEWNIRDKDGEFYQIAVVNTDQSIDLDNGQKENGTCIAIWGWHGAHQQQWKFQRVGDLPGGGGGYAAQPPQQQQQQYQQGEGGGGYIAQPPQQQQAPPPPVQTYSGAVPPGVYVLENAFAGTAADLAGAGITEGTPITGWQCNRGANQTWDLVPAQNGYYFKNSASGTYLGFDGDGSEGNKICGSSRPVEWQVNQAGQPDQANKVYSVHLASNNSIVLDLAGGGNKDGVPICLYTNHSGANQQWKFTSPS